MLCVDTQLFMKGANTDFMYTVGVGNYRLVYAWRFGLDRKMQEIPEPIPEILGN